MARLKGQASDMPEDVAVRLGLNGEISFYELLGVTRTATLEEIKKRFRKEIAFQFSPDLVPDNQVEEKRIRTEIMKLMNAAYATLTDSEKKLEYDEGRADRNKKPWIDPNDSFMRDIIEGKIDPYGTGKQVNQKIVEKRIMSVDDLISIRPMTPETVRKIIQTLCDAQRKKDALTKVLNGSLDPKSFSQYFFSDGEPSLQGATEGQLLFIEIFAERSIIPASEAIIILRGPFAAVVKKAIIFHMQPGPDSNRSAFLSSVESDPFRNELQRAIIKKYSHPLENDDIFFEISAGLIRSREVLEWLDQVTPTGVHKHHSGIIFHPKYPQSRVLLWYCGDAPASALESMTGTQGYWIDGPEESGPELLSRSELNECSQRILEMRKKALEIRRIFLKNHRHSVSSESLFEVGIQVPQGKFRFEVSSSSASSPQLIAMSEEKKLRYDIQKDSWGEI